jgi:glycosyltransferase involved in cell wall biosynthesis
MLGDWMERFRALIAALALVGLAAVAEAAFRLPADFGADFVETFRRMCDRSVQGWELHLAGACSPEHEPYLAYLEGCAGGYPIRFHVDCDHETLARLYEESGLYWHATGFGTDPELEPEKQEHFGITTCEAMSMGCVPIVIRRGGQPEIVEPGRSGSLWDDEGELARGTRLLVEDDRLRRELALSAIERFEDLVRRREQQLQSLLAWIEA